MDTTQQILKRFVLDNSDWGATAQEITADTPLNAGGLLDSLATLKLVAFLEEKFNVEVQPEDLESGQLSSLARIERLIDDRRAAQG